MGDSFGLLHPSSDAVRQMNGKFRFSFYFCLYTFVFLNVCTSSAYDDVCVRVCESCVRVCCALCCALCLVNFHSTWFKFRTSRDTNAHETCAYMCRHDCACLCCPPLLHLQTLHLSSTEKSRCQLKIFHR